MQVKELGDARNITLHFAAHLIEIPWAGAYYGDTDPRIQSFPLPVGPGFTDQFTIRFTAYLKYWGKVGPMYMPQEIVFNALDWDMRRTADGIVIENGREAEDEYTSSFLSLDIIGGQASSSATNRARVTIQGKISPTNGASGQAQVSIPVVGGLGYSAPPVITVSHATSAQYVWEFVDIRTKPAPPKPRPIVLPADMMVTLVRPYVLGHKELTAAARDVVHQWLNKLVTRDDCAELYRAIIMSKKDKVPIVKITGTTDGSGNDQINDQLSIDRAEIIKNMMLDRLGRGDGGAENSISWKGIGADRAYAGAGSVKLPKTPDSQERYVKIIIQKEYAEKVIGEMRQEAAAAATK